MALTGLISVIITIKIITPASGSIMKNYNFGTNAEQMWNFYFHYRVILDDGNFQSVYSYNRYSVVLSLREDFCAPWWKVFAALKICFAT